MRVLICVYVCVNVCIASIYIYIYRHTYWCVCTFVHRPWYMYTFVCATVPNHRQCRCRSAVISYSHTHRNSESQGLGLRTLRSNSQQIHDEPCTPMGSKPHKAEGSSTQEPDMHTTPWLSRSCKEIETARKSGLDAPVASILHDRHPRRCHPHLGGGPG